jgi:hypothetical protein
MSRYDKSRSMGISHSECEIESGDRRKEINLHLCNRVPRVVPWLRRLVADISPRRSRSVHVEAKWKWVRFYPSSSVFLCLSFHRCFLMLISSEGWTKGPLVVTAQRHSLTPSTWTTTGFRETMKNIRPLSLICFFVHGLFNDAVGSSDHRVSNDRIING